MGATVLCMINNMNMSGTVLSRAYELTAKYYCSVQACSACAQLYLETQKLHACPLTTLWFKVPLVVCQFPYFMICLCHAIRILISSVYISQVPSYGQGSWKVKIKYLLDEALKDALQKTFMLSRVKLLSCLFSRMLGHRKANHMLFQCQALQS